MGKSKIISLLLLLGGAAVYVLSGSYAVLCVLAAAVFALLGMELYVAVSGRCLSGSFVLPESGEKEQVFTGVLHIANHSILPVLKGRCIAEWENSLTGEHGSRKICFAVSGKKETEVELQAKVSYSGVCTIRIKRVEIFDPFAIFCRKRSLSLEGSTVILPTLSTFPAASFREEAYDMESFRYSQVRKGEDSGETYQVRSYMAGDSMKQIHWKLTAKLDDLTVRESSYPIFDSILILMETGFAGALPKPEQMDAQLSVALSMVRSMADGGVPCEFGFYNYKNQKAFLERVESPEDFWQVMLPAVEAGRSAQSEAGVQHFLENCGDKQFAHYIYVTAGEVPELLERLRRESKVTVLCCAEQYAQSGEGKLFTASGWQEELKNGINCS